MSQLPSSHEEPAPFDARLFEPPPWAASHLSAYTDLPKAGSSDSVADSNDDFQDALSQPDLGVEEDLEGLTRFTTDELKKLLARATALKDSGNKHFLSKPKRLDEARESYLLALDNLPDLPPPRLFQAATEAPSGIQEVTDEEATAIEAENAREKDSEREDTEQAIRECEKAVHGNLAAVYIAQEEWKSAVDACTKALKIDEGYLKALHRRAVANEKLGTWSSLSSAQEDYTALAGKLPRSSPQLPEVRRALKDLPARIAVQQEKEKDEMLGKLKDLGNSLLGKFGLNTDMFKFDEQPGGGYNLRFES